MPTDQDNDLKKDDDYTFIQEKIAHKKKNKLRSRVFSAFFVVFLGGLFGVSARLAYYGSDDTIKELFGIQTESNAHAVIPTAVPPLTSATDETKANADVSATVTASKIPTVPVQIAANDNTDTEPSGKETTQHATIAASPTGSGLSYTPVTEIPNDVKESPAEKSGDEISEISNNEEGYLNEYIKMYQEINSLVDNTKSSIVKIVAIEQGIDWFHETYEKRTVATGIVLGNNGTEILVLVNLDKIQGATYLETTFNNGKTVQGNLFSYDSDYHMAVVAVKVQDFKGQDIDNIKPANILYDEDTTLGTPIIAIGTPNGYQDSIEIGIVTSTGSKLSVSDGEIEYFTTNMPQCTDGDGFIVDLAGNVVGIINHNLSEISGISTVMSFKNVRQVLACMTSKADKAYLGIKAENLPVVIGQQMGITSGIYVKEVDNSSPALAAEIKSGDVIYEIDGKPVESVEDLCSILSGYQQGATVKLSLCRIMQGKVKNVTVTAVLSKKSR